MHLFIFSTTWLSKLGRCIFPWLFQVFQTKFFKIPWLFHAAILDFVVCVIDVSVRDSAGEKSRGCRQENGYYSLEKNSWCKTKKIKWSYGNKFLGQRHPNMQLLPLFTSSSFCIWQDYRIILKYQLKSVAPEGPILVGSTGQILESNCLLCFKWPLKDVFYITVFSDFTWNIYV